MKKGISVQSYLPVECYKIFKENEKKFIKDLENFDVYIKYDIYVGTYYEKNVCALDLTFIGDTFKKVEDDYMKFKKYIKELTNNNLKQIYKMKFDRF